jgi:hypothetical protein
MYVNLCLCKTGTASYFHCAWDSIEGDTGSIESLWTFSTHKSRDQTLRYLLMYLIDVFSLVTTDT